LKESKSGKKFFSLSVKPKEAKPMQSNAPEIELGDLPF